MFNWLGGLLGGLGSAIGSLFTNIGEEVINAIWDGLVKWLLQSFYDTLADVFTQIGSMGADIFDLTWIVMFVRLFTMLGWVLFGVGMIVAAFDLALEYQNGRANIKSTAINVLKGFFAANLVTLVPVELYKFCINLQNVFLKDLAASFVGSQDFNLGDVALKVMVEKFGGPAGMTAEGIFSLCMLVGLSYSVLRVFFGNIKRGGILLIQMAVGEVPRIAQQFGLDSSVKVNMMSIVRATSTAVNMTRSITRALA